MCPIKYYFVCVFTQYIAYIFWKYNCYSTVWTVGLFSQIASEHLAIRDKKFTLSYRTIIGVQLQCELIPLAIEPFSYARGKNSLGGLPLDGFYLELIYQSKCIEIGWAGVIHWNGLKRLHRRICAVKWYTK